MRITSTHNRLVRHDSSSPRTVENSNHRQSKSALFLNAFRRLAIMLCFFAVPGFAQSTSSTGVVGRVTDATGAVIPGAKVHVIDPATNSDRTVTTNDSGDYTVQNLPPSTYTIRVEKTGFKTASLTNIPLEVGKTGTQPVVLQVGASTETIEISTEGAQMQTQDASVGQVITEKQVSDLPLNGRNMLQLASLTAGVSAEDVGQTGNAASNGGIGTRNLYITVDGGRASSNNYMLDGVSIRSIRYNTMDMITSADATQEFNVVRSVASTEYGQGTATITMVTKSGSNKIHGSVYEYTRSSIFDARNYFSTYTTYPHKPVYHRNQYGFTAGAPIIKDRLFVFAGYEHQGSVQAKPAFANFPTVANFQSVGIDPTNPTTPYQLINVLLPTFYAQGLFTPSPGCGPSPYTACSGNDFGYTSNFVDNYTTWTGRSDQTISSKQNLFERYIDYNSIQLSPSAFAVVQSPIIGRNMAIGHTYIFKPWLVNELRLGWNHTYQYAITTSPYTNQSWATKAGLTNVTGNTLASEFGRPTITISPFTALGGDIGATQGDATNIYSIGDTISIVKGKHSIRTGFQFSWRQAIQQTEQSSNGSFSFSANTGLGYATPLAAFAAGFAATASGANGTSKGHYTDQTYGIFATDIWQIAPKLTLNYGVRWEYASPFAEKNDLEAGFDPASAQIAFHKVPALCTATVTLFCIPQAISTLGIFNLTPNFYPKGIIKPTKNRFAPRVGVAYQITPTFVTRAGFGVYVENVNTNELQFTRNITPLYVSQNLVNVSINNQFQSINNYVPSTTSGFPAPFSVNAKNRTPYSYEWDFSIAKSLPHQTVIEAAYTGSDTHLLWRRYDANEDIFPGPVQPATQIRPFNGYSHGMLTSANVGHANFQGGSIRFEQRPVHGFYYLGVYQYSKNQDDESGEVDANDTAFSNNLAFDRAVSQFDTRHRATISGGYSLPFGAGQKFLTNGIGNVLAGGWSIQPIVSMHTGFPFSISGGSAQFGTNIGYRAFLAPGRTLASAKLAHRTAAEWFDPTAFCINQGVKVLGGSTSSTCPELFSSPGVPVASTVLGNPGNNFWQGNVRRNALVGPGGIQNDLSVLKNIKIHDSISAQFRAEAFNILNRKILSNPTANQNSSSDATISSTSADNRDIQFALKILF